jgi:phage shock protein PspC (stress-responsive transcriptional regulator)
MIKPADSNILERDVHCPFCKTKDALLMSRAVNKKLSFQTPAFGLRFILLLLFYPLTIFLYGFKAFEINKGIRYDTYGFCPNCGNSYSASPPEKVAAKVEEPKFYRSTNSKIRGLCAGIADYTDLPTGWVRLVSAVYLLAPFAMRLMGIIALIRAEASFSDVLSAFVSAIIPSIAVAVLYFVIAIFVPVKPTQQKG